MQLLADGVETTKGQSANRQRKAPHRKAHGTPRQAMVWALSSEGPYGGSRFQV